MVKTKPNLISSKTFKHIDKLTNTNTTYNIGSNSLWFFYNDYIKPNLFPLLVFVIISVFLTLRYMIKKNKKKKTKKIIKKIKKNTNSNIVQQPLELVSELPDISEPDTNSSITADSIGLLEKEYNKDKQTGYMSDQMLKETYEKKTAKLSFDELARVIAGGE